MKDVQVKSKDQHTEDLESALIDLLDGQSRWDEIQALTCCSENSHGHTRFEPLSDQTI